MATITTLIPAYNPAFLGEVFLGLRRQSYRDFRVVLSDDSPGDEISHLIRDGHFGNLLDGLDIEVICGPKNARQNHNALLAHWAGSSPLVHFHLDDDAIYPEFYRLHAQAHAGGRYAASVSRRWITLGDTRPAQAIELPAFVADSPLRVVPVQAADLFQTTVPTCNNWLGEFSNMVLSAPGLAHWPRGTTRDLNYFGWLDIGFLLEAGQHLPLAYLRDHLGVYRQHPAQTTHNMHAHGGLVSSIAWASYALKAWRDGRIDARQAVHGISYNVMQCLKRYGEDSPTMNRFFDLVQHHGASLDELHRHFLPFWLELLAAHPSTRAPAEAGATAAAPAAHDLLPA